MNFDDEDTPTELPEEGHTDPRIRIERKRTDIKLVGVVVVAIGTVFGAYRVVLGEAAAQTDAGIRVHEQRISTLEQQQRQVRDDLHEVQVDIRALYKTVRTGERQERLEKPAPASDGGSR